MTLDDATSVLVARDPAVPGLARLLDDAALADVLGAPVTGTYLRYKPGTSLVLAARLTGARGNGADGDLPGGGEPGAVVVARSYAPAARAKLDKTLRKAPAGSVLALDEAGATIVTRWDADRALPGARLLLDRGARRALGDAITGPDADVFAAEPRLVRYNPDRRAVLRLGTGGERVAARLVPPARMAGPVAGYRLLGGAPVRVPQILLVHRRGIVCTQWLPGTPADAQRDGHPDGAVMARVGTALARLHRWAPDPGGAAARGARSGVGQAPMAAAAAAAAGVVGLRPGLAGMVDAVLGRLADRPPRAARPTAVHGDFSLDQVILDDDAGIGFVDLDRAGMGDPAHDVASFIAHLICTGRAGADFAADPLAGAFLAAYGRAGLPLHDLPGLVAAHLLGRACEPFRTRRPDWPDRMDQLVRAALALVRGADAGAVARARVRARVPARVADFAIRAAFPRSAEHALLTGTIGGEVAAGQWFADPSRAATVADGLRAAGPGEGGPGEARRGETSGVVHRLGVGAVVIHRAGRDPQLPRLAELCAVPGARLVAHRPGRRGVVRGPDGSYTKITARVAGPPPRVPTGSFGTARELARDAHSVTTAALPGRTLHQWLTDPATPDHVLAALAGAVGGALRRLHRTADRGLAAHPAAAECAVAARWLRFAHAFGALPDPADILAGLAAAMRAAPVTAAVFTHGDLHDKQLILEPGGPPGLIDFDLVAAAHPALDLANLLAHLHLRVLQGICPAVRAAQFGAAVVAAYEPSAEVRAALPAYGRAARARLAGVYSFRPGRRAVVAALLQTLDDPLLATGTNQNSGARRAPRQPEERRHDPHRAP